MKVSLLVPKLLYSIAATLIAIATLVGAAIMTFSLVVSQLVPWETPRGVLCSSAPFGIALILLVCGTVTIRRFGWRWLWLMATVPTGIFAFLTHDEAIQSPPDLGPRVGADDPGYRTLMWMSKNSPYSRLQEPGADNPAFVELGLPEDQNEWAEHVTKHREQIIDAWNRITLGREWFQALADHPPAGVWENPNTSPYIYYKPVRATVGVTLAHAYLLALDGKPDNALRETIQLIRAMYNYQRTSPALLNAAIAGVVLKKSYPVVAAMLRLGPPSAEIQDLISDTLQAAPSLQKMFRNVFCGEQEWARGVLDRVIFESNDQVVLTNPNLPHWEKILARLAKYGWAYNRNLSERLLTDSLNEALALAEARDKSGLERWQPNWNSHSQLKNPVGRSVVAMILPPVQKNVALLWSNEVARLNLLRQIHGKQRVDEILVQRSSAG